MNTYTRQLSSFFRRSRNWIYSQINAAFIANILTLLTLWYTVSQSNKNEIDNNTELRRIRTRDSIQNYRDSIRTNVLIRQLTEQSNESKRNRSKDASQLKLFSSQISLLNKSLQSQNEGITIQNKSLKADLLAKQSQIIMKVKFGVNGFDNGYTSPVLSYSLTNVGNSIAQNIISNYCIVSIDHTDNERVKCINNYEGTYTDVSVKPGEMAIINPLVSVGIPLIKRNDYIKFKKEKYNEMSERHWNERKDVKPPYYQALIDKQRKEEEEFRKKYPAEDFSNYIIIKVSYTDKYQNTANEVYTLLTVTYHVNTFDGTIQVDSRPTTYSKFPYLIKCIKENGFNENQIREQLRKSTSKDENTFSVIQ